MRKKNLKVRLFAMLTAVAICMTNMPALQSNVKGAEAKYDLSRGIELTGSKTAIADVGGGDPGVEFEVALPAQMDTKQELEEAGVQSLVIKLRVTDFTPAAGGTPGVLAYIMSKAWNWYDGGSWTELSKDTDITLSLDFANLNWGNSNEIGKTGMQFTNIAAGSTISYEITDIYFSTLEGASNAPSSGGGESGGGNSGSLVDTTTDKNLDIEYNFAKLLQQSLYFYDANMCGSQVGEKSAIGWRDDCHTYDSQVTYTDSQGIKRTVDVSGGFHDAGDHVKFGVPQGYAASCLALSYYMFSEAYDELGQTGHFNTIMDYFCEYFIRCTIYKSGSTSEVEAFCYQVGEGNSDHARWEAPEVQTAQTLPRPAYFATAAKPGTDVVSLAACALALTAKNYEIQNVQPEKQAAYLKTAKDLFAFAKACEKAVAVDGTVNFYDSSSYADDYASAAAALYVATKDASYKSDMENAYNGKVNTGYLLAWDNSWPIAATLKGDYNSLKQMSAYGNTVTTQGFKYIDKWGSARYNASLQFTGLMYDKAMDKLSMQNGDFSAWATGQMKYLLGNNNDKRCFVVGYNADSAKYPHHRAASRSTDGGQMREDHYTLLGALVGGPDSVSDHYVDDQGDYVCNEVALDYNVGLVGAAAGLYLLHKGEEAYPTSLSTKAELENVAVRVFYTNDENSSSQPTSKPSTSPSPSPSVKPEESASPSPSPSVKPEESTSPSPSPSVKPEESTSPSPSATPASDGGGKPEMDETFEVGDVIAYDDANYEVLEMIDDKIIVCLQEVDEAVEDYSVETLITDGNGQKYYVREIADRAFAKCKNIKTVNVKEGIVRIGKKAFYKCSKLKKVTLPNSLELVDNSAFEGCKSLATITLPKNVQTIGKRAFYGCVMLKTVTIKSAKLVKIGGKAFQKLKPAAVIKLPKTKYSKYMKLLKKKYDSGVRFKKK